MFPGRFDICRQQYCAKQFHVCLGALMLRAGRSHLRCMAHSHPQGHFRDGDSQALPGLSYFLFLFVQIRFSGGLVSIAPQKNAVKLLH